MDEDAVIRYITDTFAGVDLVESSGDRYVFYNPADGQPPDHRFPFATLVTGDRHDTVSHLDRPDVYRLNVGVSRDTYRALFGSEIPRAGDDGIVATGHDFAALDQIMPHPVYAPQFWVCVLNPSKATFASVRPLLAEAYARAVSRRAKFHPAGDP